MFKHGLDEKIMKELWSRKALDKFAIDDGFGGKRLRVDGFITHLNWTRHFDEVYAYYFATRNPEHMRFPHFVTGWELAIPEMPWNFYPGFLPAVRASVQFVHECGTADEADDFLRSMRREGKNYIQLGIGTLCPFNEHGDKPNRKVGDCTSVRLANCADMRNELQYKKSLDEILRSDVEATQRYFEPGTECKRAAGLSFPTQELLQLMFMRFDMARREGQQMESCESDFGADGYTFEVNGVHVGMMVTNNPFAAKYLRYLQCDIQVVFTPGPDGERNVVIQLRIGAESLRWYSELAEIGRAEMAAAGRVKDPEIVDALVVKTREAAEKDEETDLPMSKRWRMFKRSLMNGSHSIARPPTRLTFQEFVVAITRALEKVPPRGKSGELFVGFQVHLRKAKGLIEDNGEGASAAFEGNLPELEKRLLLSLEMVRAAKKRLEPQLPAEEKV